METAPHKRYERTHTNGEKTKSIHRQVQGQDGDEGGQGGKDLGRVGIGISGTSESDIRLEEAVASERAGDIFWEQGWQGQERGSKCLTEIAGKNIFLKLVRAYNNTVNTVYMGHFFDRAPYRKLIINRKQLMGLKLVMFENRNYYIFSDVENYFANRFGCDFMSPPTRDVIDSFHTHCIKYVQMKKRKSE